MKFHILTIVSGYTVLLLDSPDEEHPIQHIKRLYGFLVNEGSGCVSTIGLLAAKDTATHELMAQFPFLSDIDISGVTPDNYIGFGEQLVRDYGDWHDVTANASVEFNDTAESIRVVAQIKGNADSVRIIGGNTRVN